MWGRYVNNEALFLEYFLDAMLSELILEFLKGDCIWSDKVRLVQLYLW